MTRPRDANDAHVTLRLPRFWLALSVAVLVHAAAGVVVSLLPEPKKPVERVEISLQSPPPPVAATAPAQASPTPRRRSQAPSLPVRPELPPSKDPPEHRAQLPVVESLPEPTPAMSWAESVRSSLSATRPQPLSGSGLPLPDPATVARIANADPRLHDEETEQRLMEDHGAFFRRGLEALRSQWRPGEVLQQIEGDPMRRCGRTTRTTYAVAVLDKEGNVVDVDLKKPSGCPELDAEAIAAFKRVARFPHPPDGIFVGPDGAPLRTARYPVRFIVTFDGGLQLDWR